MGIVEIEQLCVCRQSLESLPCRSAPSSNMGSDPNNNDRPNPEYLAQLLKDKRQIQNIPNVFIHLERILDEEINRVRVNLFHQNTTKEPLQLPEPKGNIIVSKTEKLYVPVKLHPDFNFVGRILGPRGMTAKQLEQDTGCKIMVRGKGSMRDKNKEEFNRGKPNWEHLDEDLHVLITVEDTEERAAIKLNRAIEEVKKLLVPSAEGEDDLKKLQLMELAIINGTYRDGNKFAVVMPNMPNNAQIPPPQMMGPTQMAMSPTIMRSPGPAGAPLILAPRLPLYAGPLPSPAMMNGSQPPPLLSPGDQGGMFVQFDPNGYFTFQSPIYEYPPNCIENQNIVCSMPYVR